MVRNIVEHPEHGFSLLNIMQIMAVVRNRYGRMQKNSKLDLKEKMTARLASTNLFDSHISNLKQLFFISTTGGQPITEADQVEYLRTSLSGNPLIDSIISQYMISYITMIPRNTSQIIYLTFRLRPKLLALRQLTAWRQKYT
jgi:hypothetical protein